MILNFAKENGFKVGTIGLLPVLHSCIVGIFFFTNMLSS